MCRQKTPPSFLTAVFEAEQDPNEKVGDQSREPH